MTVTMVYVRNMLVLMSQAGMFVRVRVWFGTRSFMSVLMVLVVNVQMLMQNDLVDMDVAMPFAD